MPPPKYYRLSPGREVRLRYAYFITCAGVKKDEKTGEIIEVHCTYDPATRGGDAPDGRRVQSTMHWVSAAHALEAEVRLYDHLFTKENPMEVEEGADYKDYLNPNSLEVLKSCRVEPFSPMLHPAVYTSSKGWAISALTLIPPPKNWYLTGRCLYGIPG